MKYFKNEETGKIYGYSLDQQSLIDMAIENGLNDVSDVWPEPPSSDALAELARTKRNILLSQSDWTALKDSLASSDWLVYRKKLRDITNQEGFPLSITWPDKPLNKAQK